MAAAITWLWARREFGLFVWEANGRRSDCEIEDGNNRGRVEASRQSCLLAMAEKNFICKTRPERC
jgi:hypothetical protein